MFFVFGSAQPDLFILTDGALPLPAQLLSRIVAYVRLDFFFLPLCCMYRLHQDLLCCISTYLIWSFLIYEPFLIHYFFL